MSAVFHHLLLATEHSEFDSGAEALAFALARRCQLPLAGDSLGWLLPVGLTLLVVVVFDRLRGAPGLQVE